MAVKTRLYRVTQKSTGKVSLIEAASVRGAISHAAQDDFSADIPANHEVFALAKAGVEVQVAKEGTVSDETRTAVSQGQLLS